MKLLLLLIALLVSLSSATDSELTHEEAVLYAKLEVNATIWEFDEYSQKVTLRALDRQNKNNSETRVKLITSIFILNDVITEANRVINEHSDTVSMNKLKSKLTKAKNLLTHIKINNSDIL